MRPSRDPGFLYQVLQPEAGDSGDLVQCGLDLLLADVGQPLLGAGENRLLGVVPHADHVWEAELLPVGRVQPVEPLVLLWRKPVQAGGRLLVRGRFRKLAGERGLPGEVRVRPDQGDAPLRGGIVNCLD